MCHVSTIRRARRAKAWSIVHGVKDSWQPFVRKKEESEFRRKKKEIALVTPET